MGEESDSKRMRLKVFIRLRPVVGDNKNGVVKPEHKLMYLTDPAKQGHSSEFVFDRIFDAASSQEDVFEEASLSSHSMWCMHGLTNFACPGHRLGNRLLSTSCEDTMHAALPMDRQVSRLHEQHMESKIKTGRLILT